MTLTQCPHKVLAVASLFSDSVITVEFKAFSWHTRSSYGTYTTCSPCKLRVLKAVFILAFKTLLRTAYLIKHITASSFATLPLPHQHRDRKERQEKGQSSNPSIYKLPNAIAPSIITIKL